MTTTRETGLPDWAYSDPDFFALERSKVFAPSWQIVCHQSDIAERGHYATLNFLGQLVSVIRGDDGKVRAFRNVCRHRAARLLDEDFGRCSSRITCPYHAWSYDLRGRLVGAPRRDAYDDFANEDYGLWELPLNEAGGFLFVNTQTDGETASFDDFIAPVLETFDIYKTEEMRALGRISLRERAVNWKIGAENYVDVFHLNVAHHGLTGLVGDSYSLSVEGDACVITSDIETRAGQTLSARAYRTFLPEAGHLPAERRWQWRYVMLWPNLAFDIYPDQIDFMQFIPLAPDRTLLREISYALPDVRREMAAARYLNWRINRVVNIEDRDVIERTQAGLASAAGAPGPIARDEKGLIAFAERMRRAAPICAQKERPTAAAIRAARDA
ncbi:MAG: aromatic ring-hydroxylating dioxygenase subunit alpha [Pseudomonadota bacterium]